MAQMAIRTGRALATLFVAQFLLSHMQSANAQQAEQTKPELHYLVIDMSGSVIENALVVPIRGSVVRFLGSVPENAEVRIRLFDHEMTSAQVYGPPFTVNHTGLASTWLHENYKPGNGNTLLFETVGTVFEEVVDETENYSSVSIVILTDGNNDARNLKGQKIPTKFNTWDDVESISRDIQKSTGQSYVARLYTINHTPKTLPDESSGIKTEPVPDNTQIVIQPATAMPKADFDLHPKEVEVGGTVALWPLRDWGIEKFLWTLSDGRTSTEPRPKFTFDQPGEYAVTLQVAGPGGEDERTIAPAVRVSEQVPPPAPKADFIAHPESVVSGSNVLFTAVSEAGIESYAWDFGDGNASTESKPLHSYDEANAYDVTLKVKGPGGEDEFTKAAAVIVADPPVDLAVADFDATPTKGDFPLTVQFTDKSKGEIVSYQWYFDDGYAVSDLHNPAYTYDSTGTYRPRLTVTNTKGISSTSSGDLVIEITEPPKPLPWWVPAGIIGILAALALLILHNKFKPQPISGRLRYTVGDNSKMITLEGTKLDLVSLGIPDWQPKVAYTIENKGGIKLFKNGLMELELDKRKEFIIEGVEFKYLPQ